MALYPFRFEPLYRHYLWGGRRLESVLGKMLGAGDHFAESWEVVDHGEDQSRIRFGAQAGQTLGEVRQSHPRELLGRHAPLPRFPLLFKYLDAQQNLSVQVHPDDRAAAQLVPPDLGKTEAWVVVHADPGSRIYAGLKRGFDRAAFEREVRRGTAHLCLHSFTPRAGDCVFVPAGVVHAIGAGLVVAEIQQASDTTFRLFDWGRVGPDGRPRALHIAEALSVIDFDYGPVMPEPAAAPTFRGCERLLACDKFVLDRWRLVDPCPVGGDGRFHIVSVLEGRLTVDGDPARQPLVKGETTLIPASVAATLSPQGHAMWLDMYLP